MGGTCFSGFTRTNIKTHTSQRFDDAHRFDIGMDPRTPLETPYIPALRSADIKDPLSAMAHAWKTAIRRDYNAPSYDLPSGPSVRETLGASCHGSNSGNYCGSLLHALLARLEPFTAAYCPEGVSPAPHEITVWSAADEAAFLEAIGRAVDTHRCPLFDVDYYGYTAYEYVRDLRGSPGRSGAPGTIEAVGRFLLGRMAHSVTEGDAKRHADNPGAARPSLLWDILRGDHQWGDGGGETSDEGGETSDDGGDLLTQEDAVLFSSSGSGCDSLWVSETDSPRDHGKARLSHAAARGSDNSFLHSTDSWSATPPARTCPSPSCALL